MVEDVNKEILSEGIFHSDKSFEYHEYADVFPLMDLNELNKLGLNMQKYGLKEPIVLYEGEILDGRNRSLAGHMFNAPLIYIKFEDTIYADLDPLDFVEIKNLHRREFKNSAQRAFSALKRLKIERKRAIQRMRSTQLDGKDKNNKPKFKDSASNPGSPAEENLQKGRAIDITAKKYGIAPKTLIKVERIVNIAEKDSKIDNLWHRALKCELTIEQVYRSIQDKINKKKSQTLNRKNERRNRKERKKVSTGSKNNKVKSSQSNEEYKVVNKTIKLYETGKDDPNIINQLEKVKKGELSLDEAIQNAKRIKTFTKSIRKHNVDSFTEAGKTYEKKKVSNNKKKKEELQRDIHIRKDENLTNSQVNISLKKMYICKRCPKATVMAIECECEECGHLNLTPKVLCDDDMTNGSRRLRDPNSELCKNSPDYDLLVRN